MNWHFFIVLSLIDIISLCIMIKSKFLLMKILMAIVFVLYLVFGFALSYLFSLQIKSAHQSYQLTNSIISRCKMRLTLKFKVN